MLLKTIVVGDLYSGNRRCGLRIVYNSLFMHVSQFRIQSYNQQHSLFRISFLQKKSIFLAQLSYNQQQKVVPIVVSRIVVVSQL